jgi:hypothetical protein
MMVLSTVTRVRADGEGRLTAECRLCQITFIQVAGVNLERALAAFDVSHAPHAATHRRTVLWGWTASATGHGPGSSSPPHLSHPALDENARGGSAAKHSRASAQAISLASSTGPATCRTARAVTCPASTSSGLRRAHPASRHR